MAKKKKDEQAVLRSGPIKDFLRPMLQEFERQFDESIVTRVFTPEFCVIPTGYVDLDSCLSGLGLPVGGVTVVAGPAGIGKTTFALNLVKNICVLSAKPVSGMYMAPSGSLPKLTKVLVGMVGSVDKEKMDTMGVRFDDFDWPKLTNAAGLLSEAPLFLDTTVGMSIDHIVEAIREGKENRGLKLVVIDHLHLVEAPPRENRHAEISFMSRTLKALARELDIAIVVVSSLNRSRLWRGQGAYQTPLLSDLRESGTLEDDADLVLFAHRNNQDCPVCIAGDYCSIHYLDQRLRIIVGKQSLSRANMWALL